MMIWTRPDDEILHARHPDKDRLGWYRVPENLEMNLHPISGTIVSDKGILGAISTNVLDYGSDLSQDELFGFMKEVHKPNPDSLGLIIIGSRNGRMILSLREGKIIEFPEGCTEQEKTECREDAAAWFQKTLTHLNLVTGIQDKVIAVHTPTERFMVVDKSQLMELLR